MNVYVDTSALFAVLDGDDSCHLGAEAVWIRLIQEDAALVSSNYVLVEASALLQRRLGPKALRVFQDDIVPMLRIQWVDEPTHQAAVQMLLKSRSRSLSLVDCVSFVVMRRMGLGTAFVFDKHFQTQGFRCLTRIPCE